MAGSANTLTIIGALLALGGIAAFAVPEFTTHQTEEVAHIGDLKVQANEEKSHVIPPLVSGGAIVIGIVLIGAGVMRRS
jgi:hypothetical protein